MNSSISATVPRPVKCVAAVIPLTVVARDVYQWYYHDIKIEWKRTVVCLVISALIAYTIPHRYLPLDPHDFETWPPKKE